MNDSNCPLHCDNKCCKDPEKSNGRQAAATAVRLCQPTCSPQLPTSPRGRHGFPSSFLLKSMHHILFLTPTPPTGTSALQILRTSLYTVQVKISRVAQRCFAELLQATRQAQLFSNQHLQATSRDQLQRCWLQISQAKYTKSAPTLMQADASETKSNSYLRLVNSRRCICCKQHRLVPQPTTLAQ